MSLLGEVGSRVVEEKPGFGYACVRKLSRRYDMAPDYLSGCQISG